MADGREAHSGHADVVHRYNAKPHEDAAGQHLDAAHSLPANDIECDGRCKNRSQE